MLRTSNGKFMSSAARPKSALTVTTFSCLLLTLLSLKTASAEAADAMMEAQACREQGFPSLVAHPGRCNININEARPIYVYAQPLIGRRYTCQLLAACTLFGTDQNACVHEPEPVNQRCTPAHRTPFADQGTRSLGTLVEAASQDDALTLCENIWVDLSQQRKETLTNQACLLRALEIMDENDYGDPVWCCEAASEY
jgi:hypothetical protein